MPARDTVLKKQRIPRRKARPPSLTRILHPLAFAQRSSPAWFAQTPCNCTSITPFPTTSKVKYNKPRRSARSQPGARRGKRRPSPRTPAPKNYKVQANEQGRPILRHISDGEAEHAHGDPIENLWTLSAGHDVCIAVHIYRCMLVACEHVTCGTWPIGCTYTCPRKTGEAMPTKLARSLHALHQDNVS